MLKAVSMDRSKVLCKAPVSIAIKPICYAIGITIFMLVFVSLRDLG
jgi:hypothetical protein